MSSSSSACKDIFVAVRTILLLLLLFYAARARMGRPTTTTTPFPRQKCRKSFAARSGRPMGVRDNNNKKAETKRRMAFHKISPRHVTSRA